MLRGRLGLERVRIPYNARHGLVWLDRGKLDVQDGCLRFTTAGGMLEAGEYEIADLYRDTTTLRIAFGAMRDMKLHDMPLERLVRRQANAVFANEDVIPSMIERIKQMLVPP